jgi:hypothetical protein
MAPLPSFDRASLGFGARRLADGIHVNAWFDAPKLSTGQTGSYRVQMTVDPKTGGLSNPTFHVSRGGKRYLAAHGSTLDGLRKFAYQIRDRFLHSQAWAVLKDRAPDPDFSVNHLGETFTRAETERSWLRFQPGSLCNRK